MKLPASTALTASLVLVAGPLAAQATPAEVRHRDDCRLAAQIVATGRPAPREEWAVAYVSVCGAEGAAAVAAALRAARHEVDPLRLDSLTRWTRRLQDAQLFQAALEVAGDPGASVPARVVSFRALAQQLDPGQEMAYEELLAAPGLPDALPRSCGIGRLVHPTDPYVGIPLPTDAPAQVLALTSRIRADTGEPADVRAAAKCAELVARHRDP